MDQTLLRRMREVAARAPSPLMFAGMHPWVCSYNSKGGRYGITLYGTDPVQVWRDNEAELPGLTIDGIADEVRRA
jgi:hypothetical protein